MPTWKFLGTKQHKSQPNFPTSCVQIVEFLVTQVFKWNQRPFWLKIKKKSGDDQLLGQRLCILIKLFYFFRIYEEEVEEASHSNRLDDDDNENLDLDTAEEVVIIELITFLLMLLKGLGYGRLHIHITTVLVFNSNLL